MRVKAQLSSRRCYDLVRCETCTHIFLKPHPTDEELREFYSRTYKPYTVVRDRFSKRARVREKLLHWVYGPGSTHNWWAPRMRWLLPNYPRYVPNGLVLDVGCGAGTILEELKDLGWRCEGIDVERSVKDRLAQSGITVHLGDALEMLRQIPAHQYNAVLSCHSLEHMRHPRAVAREILRVLQPGGEFIVTVPNHQSWLARQFGEKWFALECPAHLHIFGTRSLRYLLTTCGFVVREIYYSEVPDNYLRLSERMSKIASLYAEFRARIANFVGRGDVVTISAVRPG